MGHTITDDDDILATLTCIENSTDIFDHFHRRWELGDGEASHLVLLPVEFLMDAERYPEKAVLKAFYYVPPVETEIQIEAEGREITKKITRTIYAELKNPVHLSEMDLVVLTDDLNKIELKNIPIKTSAQP